MIQGFIRGLLVFVIVSQKNTADSFTFIRTGTNHPRQPWEGLAAAAADAASNTPTASFIRFSHCFQRHVVHADSQTVLASYRFLDDALLAFPDTPLIEIGLCNNISTTPTTDVDLVARCIAGAGRQEEFAYRRPAVQMEDDNDNKDKMNEAIEALIGLGWNGGQLGADVAGDRSVRAAIVDCVGAPRLLSHTSETISQNCEAIQALLGRALGMSPSTVRTKSLALFPQLCLCDTKDIAEKLSFLLAPRPPTDLLEKDEDIDCKFITRHCCVGPLTSSRSGRASFGLQRLRSGAIASSTAGGVGYAAVSFGRLPRGCDSGAVSEVFLRDHTRPGWPVPRSP